MRGAEIILRIGGGIGGWLVLFTYALVVAVLPVATCDPSSDDSWRGTLLLGAVAAAATLPMGLGLRWRASLKWPALVVVPLLLYDLSWVLPALAATTLGDASLCAALGTDPGGSPVPTDVERLWPAAQAVVLVVATIQSLRYWRPITS